MAIELGKYLAKQDLHSVVPLWGKDALAAGAVRDSRQYTFAVTAISPRGRAEKKAP